MFTTIIAAKGHTYALGSDDPW